MIANAAITGAPPEIRSNISEQSFGRINEKKEYMRSS